MHVEDAERFLISWMRGRIPKRSNYSTYGYDLYIPNIIRDYLLEAKVDPSKVEAQVPQVSPPFYAAAWNLCRRGILRPGIAKYGAQATPDGASGNGYSHTPFGMAWLEEAERDDYVPTEPERFAQMLQPFRDRLGPKFYERAQEVIRCYGAHAYLACCAMCGAAAESILLTTATARQDEKTVLDAYKTSNGRSRVEKMVVGQAPEQLRREFLSFTTLLQYWRDQAAHGGPSWITDNEAYTSMALLLRFALFVDDQWVRLTEHRAQ